MPEEISMHEALVFLGLDPSWERRIVGAPCIEDARKNLQLLKKELSKKRKELLMKYHPDRNRNKDTTKEMQKLLDLFKIFENLVIQPAPVRQVRVVRHYYYSSASSTTATNTTADHWW